MSYLPLLVAFFAGTFTLLGGFALGWYARDRVGTTLGEASLGPIAKPHSKGWNEPAIGSEFE